MNNNNNSPMKKAKKPKRPLSGYNLFYRYKRIKVMELTAYLSSAVGKHTSFKMDEATLIRNIIMCVPGLENTTDTELSSLSQTEINNLRSSKICSVMTGDKLFPNENKRDRVHKRSHGLGFVEMCTITRDAWNSIDQFIKAVFCGLADIGREEYKKKISMYKKMEEDTATSAAIVTANNTTTETKKTIVAPTSVESSTVISSNYSSPSPEESNESAVPRHTVIISPPSSCDRVLPLPNNGYTYHRSHSAPAGMATQHYQGASNNQPPLAQLTRSHSTYQEDYTCGFERPDNVVSAQDYLDLIDKLVDDKKTSGEDESNDSATTIFGKPMHRVVNNRAA